VRAAAPPMVAVDQDEAVRCKIKKLLSPAIDSPSALTQNSSCHLGNVLMVLS
jgi:hypothetical protein